MFNTAATIRQGAKPDTEAKGLKAKLSLDWTGSYEVFAVGPCPLADTPNGSPIGAKLLYWHLPSDMPGAGARRRVSVQRCKPCANPHDRGDMPKYFPAGLTQYVLNNFSKKSPPYHATYDVSTPLQRLEVEKITGHQSARGRGGVIALMYETHWTGLSRPSWEREMDLQLSHDKVLRYWAGIPSQHRQTNRLYRRMRIGEAQRELSRSSGERFLAPGYSCVSHVDWLRRGCNSVLLNGPHFSCKGDDGSWGLGKISATTSTDGVYLVQFLGQPGPIKLPLSQARYTN